jgi:hypothetical protein
MDLQIAAVKEVEPANHGIRAAFGADAGWLSRGRHGAL